MKKKVTKPEPTKPRPKKKEKSITPETLKRQENDRLQKKIRKYETNFVKLIEVVNEEGFDMINTLLFVSLYPQLQNGHNIHDYRQFYGELQWNEEFRSMVYDREEIDPEKQLVTWNELPMIHHQLLDVFREGINTGYTKKFLNTIRKIRKDVIKGTSLITKGNKR